MKDVAAAASVSLGTVSNVLNHPERVSRQTVEKVQEAIRELGFVRNDAARQLRAGRSRSLGLVVLDSTNPYFADLARGAEEQAATSGVAVLVGSSGQDVDRERNYLTLFREQRVNGIILSPTSVDRDLLEEVRGSQVPTVLVDSPSVDPEIPSVSVDNEYGGYLAVHHLVQQGYRRLAFLGDPTSVQQVDARQRGAQRAVDEVEEVDGCDGVTLETIPTDSLTVIAGRSAGTELLARPAERRPEAVFCANDLLAFGLLQGVSILGGLSVPGDLAIVGFDDIDLAQWAVVPLTSVRQPARAIGAAAAQLLLGDDQPAEEPDDRGIHFRPELVVRSSSVAAGHPTDAPQ
jgi:LacI family transcriptional regulator